MITFELQVLALKALRERTGEGLMACKNALIKHNWIVDDALEHLRCQGQLAARRPGSKQPCGCPV